VIRAAADAPTPPGTPAMASARLSATPPFAPWVGKRRPICEHLPARIGDLHVDDLDRPFAAYHALCARSHQPVADQLIEQLNREAMRQHVGTGATVRVFSEKLSAWLPVTAE
jgi:hypothetical protein